MLRTLFVVCISMMLFGCGSDDKPTPSIVTFNGDWQGECQVAEGGQTSFRDIVNIEGDTSERMRDGFNDTDCQDVFSRTSYDVSISYGDTVVDFASGLDATPVDMTIGQVRFTPLTEAAASAWNDRALCGVSDYTVDEASVVPMDCEAVGFVTGSLYSLWGIDGNQLYFGATNDSQTSEERPTALGIAFPYSRVE